MELQDKSMFDPCFGNGVHDHGEDSFNEILSILDFPMESLEGENLAEDWASNLGPLPTEFLRELPPVAKGLGVENAPLGGSSMLPHESLVGCKTSGQLKREPAFVDETSKLGTPFSNSGNIQGCKTSQQLKREPAFVDETSKLGTPLVPFDHSFFQASSPVSVLESGSSNSSGKRQSIGSETSVRTKRARTKYARSRAPRSWLMRSLISVYQIFQSKRLEEEANRKEPSPPQLTKDAKKDLIPKKCTHCGITKTPQWREGPKGPKTLCNACGVRYRSGRLFPEYRPAASPTFIPSVHSNSHRKVLAMREKVAVPKMPSSVPELDSMNHSLLNS